MRMIHMDEDETVRNFAIEAAKNFAKDKGMRTYTDSEIVPGCLFAIRWGLDDDCVLVFKLSEYFEPTNYQQLIRDFL